MGTENAPKSVACVAGHEQFGHVWKPLLEQTRASACWGGEQVVPDSCSGGRVLGIRLAVKEDDDALMRGATIQLRGDNDENQAMHLQFAKLPHTYKKQPPPTHHPPPDPTHLVARAVVETAVIQEQERLEDPQNQLNLDYLQISC